MMLIGLTGGIGMGKSVASKYLLSRGEPVIDTDVLARELVAPGKPALGDIEQAFGHTVLLEDGSLDRSALAAIVFKSEANRRTLEGILHPRIRKAWVDWAAELRKVGTPRATVVIPLLFETGAEKQFDLTVCVACHPVTQRIRLAGRGWSNDQVNARIAAQLPVREKMERSHRVVWNEYSLENCHAQLHRIFAAI